jgi:acyl carrier protein
MTETDISSTGILRLLRGLLATELEYPQPGLVDADASFVDLGLDSAGAAFVAGCLEDELGIKVTADLLFDWPSARSLADHLAGSLARRAAAEPAAEAGQPGVLDG